MNLVWFLAGWLANTAVLLLLFAVVLIGEALRTYRARRRIHRQVEALIRGDRWPAWSAP